MSFNPFNLWQRYKVLMSSVIYVDNRSESVADVKSTKKS